MLAVAPFLLVLLVLAAAKAYRFPTPTEIRSPPPVDPAELSRIFSILGPQETGIIRDSRDYAGPSMMLAKQRIPSFRPAAMPR